MRSGVEDAVEGALQDAFVLAREDVVGDDAGDWPASHEQRHELLDQRRLAGTHGPADAYLHHRLACHTS